MGKENNDFPQTFNSSKKLYSEEPGFFDISVPNENYIVAASEVDTIKGQAVVIMSVYENVDRNTVHANVEIQEKGREPKKWGYRQQISTSAPGAYTFTGISGKFRVMRDIFGNTLFVTDTFAETTMPEIEAINLLEQAKGNLRKPSNTVNSYDVTDERVSRMKSLFSFFFE